MNPGNARIYAPVTRAPLLFHQNNAVSNPTQYSIQQRPSYPNASSIQHFSPYGLGFPNSSTPPSYYESYPYPSSGLNSVLPLPSAYAPVFAPNAVYASPVSPNGLALILIAILILVALDLTFVRPQKGY